MNNTLENNENIHLNDIKGKIDDDEIVPDSKTNIRNHNKNFNKKKKISEDIQKPEKMSARLQSIKLHKDLETISVDYALKSFDFKDDITYDKIIAKYTNDFIEFNNIQIKNFVFVDPSSFIKYASQKFDENSNSREFIDENSKFGTENKQNSIDDAQIFKILDDDLNEFLIRTKDKVYLNLVHLCENIIINFTYNQQRVFIKEFVEDIRFYEARDTLNYCPSFLLDGLIKNRICKLYLIIYPICHNLISDFNNLLTIFEILLDYLNYKENHPRKTIPKNKDKLAKIKIVLKALSYKIMTSNNDKNMSNSSLHAIRQFKQLQIRAAYSLSKFFSSEEFKCIDISRECLQVFALLVRDFEDHFDVNTQMVEKTIYLNIFWTKDRLIDKEHIDIIWDRIKEHQFKDNAIGFIKENSGPEDLNQLFDSFLEKKKSSIESAIEIYYKKILDKMLRSDAEVFLVYLAKLLKILMDITNSKNENEDSRKTLIYIYQQLKMRDLFIHLQNILEDKKKMNSILNKDNDAKSLAVELNIMILRLILVNFILDMMLEMKILFNCFIKIGHTLSMIFKKKKQLSMFKFFQFAHYLLHLLPIQRSKQFHIECIKNSFRQDVTLVAFKYIDEYSPSNNEENYIGSSQDKNIERTVGELEDEIYEIYTCWFGIDKGVEVIDKKDEGEFTTAIKNFTDIVLIMKFIHNFYSEYLNSPSAKFKASFNRLFLTMYDYLQDNSNEWLDLCPEFSKMYIKFEENLSNENLSINSPNSFSVIKLHDDACFCNKANCFSKSKKLKPKDYKETFSRMFYLIGKAYDDSRVISEVITDDSKYRRYLKRIYRMYLFHGTLFDKDPYACLRLALTLLDQYIIYCDEIIYMNNDNEKLKQFLTALPKVKYMLKYIVSLCQNKDKCVIIFQAMKIEESYFEAQTYEKILLFLEISTLKFKRLICKDFNSNKIDDNINKIYDELLLKDLDKKNIKDFYIFLQFGYNNLTWKFVLEKHIKIVDSVILLVDLMEKGSESLEFDKSNYSLYLLETETLLNQIIFKIIRKYIFIIKFLKNPKFIKENQMIQNMMKDGKTNTKTLNSLQEFFWSEFSQFLNYLSNHDYIKYEMRMIDLDGTTSIDKALIKEQEKELSLMNVYEKLSDNFSIKKYMLSDSSPKNILQNTSKINKIILDVIHDSKINAASIDVEINQDEIMKKIDKFLLFILKRFRKLSIQKEAKKYRGSIFQSKCNLYASFIFDEFYHTKEKALEIMNEFFTGKMMEIVDLYKYEKDYKICLLYNRDTIFLKQKYKIMHRYLNLASESMDKEIYEKIKILNKRASIMSFVEDKNKEKKIPKINSIYFKIYEETLWIILEYIEKNEKTFFFNIEFVNNIPSKSFYLDNDQMNTNIISEEHKIDKIMPVVPSKQINDISKLNLQAMFNDSQKSELKIIYEIIQNNFKSKNISPLIEENLLLKNKIKDVIGKIFEYYKNHLFLEV